MKTTSKPKENVVTIIKEFDTKLYPMFTVSILCCNRIEYSLKCIKRVLSSTGDVPFEVILLDNGSTDGTKDKLLAEFNTYPNVKILHNSVNQGFGLGHNYVLSDHARGKYFIALNNDLIVPVNWLKVFKENIEAYPEVSIFGPLPGSLRPDGSGFRPARFDNIDYIEGCCLCIMSSYAKMVGLFDTSNFQHSYCEDADLSLRVRKSGGEIKVVNFPVAHDRYILTMDTLKDEDIKGYNKKNNYVLAQKYKNYLNTRSFLEQITIRRDAAIGDVLYTEPIARYFKEQNIHCKVTLQTKCPTLCKSPNFDFIETNYTEPPEGQFIDLNLGYENNPELHIVDAYAKVAGISKLVHRKPDIYTPLNNTFTGDYIVCHLGPTQWNGRNIPMDVSREVAKNIRDLGYKIYEVGHGFTLGSDLAEDYTRASWGTTIDLIRNSSGYFGVDSAPMHIAQSFIKPGAVCFGCVHPMTRLLYPHLLIGVYKDVGCNFCLQWQLGPKTINACVRETDFCMQKLDPDEIFEAFKEGLDNYMMYTSETQKIEQTVLKYCTGVGIDIGCGTHKITKNCIGIDKRANKGVDKILDASKPLPFNTGTFDYVFSSHCLEDILDTEKTLTEWVRILKPKGYLILYLPHKNLYKDCNVDHVHSFLPEDIEFILKRLHMEIVLSKVDEKAGTDKTYYSFCVIGRKL